LDLELTAEQEALRSAVRQCLSREASIHAVVRPLLGDAPWVLDDSWRSLADMGAMALLAPPEQGGLEMGMVEAAIVAEEMGRALYPGPWLPSAVLAVRALLKVKDSDAIAAHVKNIVDGSTVYACAVPAPLEAASTTIAVAYDDRSVLDANAEHVLGGARADVLVIPSGHNGPVALWAVDVRAPGVVVSPLTSPDATSGDASIRLCRAPAAFIGYLEPVGLTAIIDDAIVAMGAEALGAAAAVLEIAVEYAKTRHQFDRPIGSFQAVQRLCVDIYESIELARSGVLLAAWAADAGEAEERHLSALRLKSFSDRMAGVADTAIQVLGGIGFTWEHDAHLYLKRLLRWSSFLGPPYSYRVEVGRLLSMAPSAALDGAKHGS
jgi:alkylation response protein AidB-like acyl-CoA dehydrogenase